MKFRFDPGQPHQTQAIRAVADLFDGQPFVEPDFSDWTHAMAPVANRLDLSDGQLLANVRKVQRRLGLPEDDKLRHIDGTLDTPEGERPVRFPNFSVEMETGTGKTYVYLRTALELHRRYGLRKFVVVVPSVAVREGVLKTLK